MKVLKALGVEIEEGGDGRSSQAQAPDHDLSDREMEILKLVVGGVTNPEIADSLVITPNTVKKHVGNIYSKLGVATRVQAIL